MIADNHQINTQSCIELIDLPLESHGDVNLNFNASA